MFLRKNWNFWLDVMPMRTILHGVACNSRKEGRVVSISWYRVYYFKIKEKQQRLLRTT